MMFILGFKVVAELFGELNDIVHAFAQRGYAQRHRIKPIK
ncbi:hypothetical protein SAOR_07110 [Salinisphaera orenii MK-B5]|uniref:Uncharacterized protein n=1 Tax=Salinisphaera orenii MK-B5 TaxID=856730 RepID=A0A423PQI5_9GAMM|nr:hypothetical protein SAOR_07110 [Salinisphaera orenii MK-B5]